MRKLVLLLMAVVFVFCGKVEKQVILKELRQMEYSRHLDEEKITAWLNHPDPEVRLRTVEVIGRVQDKNYIIPLTNRLRDDTVQKIRIAAAFALGQMFSSEAEPYLIEQIKKERYPKVVLALIEALGKCGTNKSHPVLRRYLFRSAPTVFKYQAAIATGVLAYRGYPAYSNTDVLEILLQYDRADSARWSSAYALYRISAPTSLSALADALKDSASYTRFFALKGIRSILEMINHPDFRKLPPNEKVRENVRFARSREFQSILQSAAGDSVWYGRIAFLEAVEPYKQKNRLYKAIVELLDDPNPNVRMEAINTLALFKTGNTVTVLRNIFRQDTLDYRLRGQALIALAQVSPGRALSLIQKNLENARWPQLYFYIKALQYIDTPASTQLLIQLANSPKIPVVSLALEALNGRPEVPVSLLIEKLRLVDPAISAIAAAQLAARKDTLAVTPLIEVYQQFNAPRDIEPMQAILAALDSLASPQAVPLLEKELENPFPPIREYARRALIHILGDSTITIPEVPSKQLTRWDFEPVSPETQYTARIHTSRGTIDIRLLPDKAPVTVANFVHLARSGFYNGLTFHRVVPGFVIQGGDPRGDGWGGPGYTIPCEYSDVPYDRGTVGIAHAGKDTGGSQFFITHTPQPHLNGRYTVFGRVVKGMEIVDTIMIFDKIQSIDILTTNTP